ncbi:ABC transporter ATP-binding protein [Pedococcus sp. NPDC057267]|uniref:ABC transporter ATP-binding protein n=1 Tax=Pedococcus sp. NPDC057267 TaxID=3346077 RepID=UPI00362805BE
MSQYIAELRGVAKTFGQVVALRGVDFELAAGEVHAIVGENGAGKSTLMRVLAGQMAADAGTLRFGDSDLDLRHENTGHRDGVGFVEQEGGLVAELTGAENLLLVRPDGFLAHRGQAGRELAQLAERFGGQIDTHLPVQQLAVGQRQRVEILIVMARGAKVLILDEPTAALGTDESTALAEIIRKFALEGGSVVYISHKLGEVVRLADRITVMRRGAVVATHSADVVTVERLAAEMVGEVATSKSQSDHVEELVELAMGVRTEGDTPTGRGIVATLRGVCADAPLPGEAPLRGVDLEVRSGEVLGVAGVVGSGQTTLGEVLAGLIPPTAGTFANAGGRAAYVPENRHRDGVALDLSISDNVLVHSHGRRQFARGPWFKEDTVRVHVTELLDRSSVRHGGADQPIRTLSGGNQQKAVVARELEDAPHLVVAHNPFRGLDVRAIQEVRDAMLDAAHRGAGLVLISPDLDELHLIAHRIVVMFNGRVVGEVDVNEADSAHLGQLMGGLT